MRVHYSLCRREVLLGICVSLLFASTFCYAGDKAVIEVVGFGECSDCKEISVQSSQAFAGLRVTIDCNKDGVFKTRGEGELDEEGKFKVFLPREILKDGKLEEECFAQLHSASATPCPAQDGLESSKIIILKSRIQEDGKTHTFGPAGKIKFSSAVCTSAFLWPYYKYPPLPKKLHPKFKIPPLKFFGHPFPIPSFPPKVFPPIYKKPLPPIPFYKKPLPPIPIYKKPLPPIPIYKKPLPPPIPIYKKPLPPPIPIYKKPLPPPVPIYKKPLPPPVPIYKKPLPPPVPIYKKPLPPPVPIYKKPLPPPVPVYKPVPKPKPPVYKKPLPPIPPVPLYKKPLPPIPKFPPVYKKPCPPIPKIPPFPKFPPKVFPPHPKFGWVPPHPKFGWVPPHQPYSNP